MHHYSVRDRNLVRCRWTCRCSRGHYHVRRLYRRQIVNTFSTGLRQGAYWGLAARLSSYAIPDPRQFAEYESTPLAGLAPRFDHIESGVQESLVNWGYSICDAALRTHFDSTLPRSRGLVCAVKKEAALAQ